MYSRADLFLYQDKKKLTKNVKFYKNSNFFWSDSRPEGYGFEVEVVSPGDRFTIHDASHNVIGLCEVVRNEEPQLEQSHLMWPDGGIEKWVKVKLHCKLLVSFCLVLSIISLSYYVLGYNLSLFTNG